MLAFDAHAGGVHDLRFSPDGRLLASAGSHPGLRVFDLAAGAELYSADPPLRACSAVRFSPDGRLLVTGELPAVAVRDAATGDVLRVMAGPGYLWDLHPDGRALLYEFGNDSRHPTVPRWFDLATGREVGSLTGFAAGSAFRMACSPDGRWVGHVSNLFRLLDAVTGAEEARAGTGRDCYAVAFSPDGRLVAFSDGPHVVKWDVAERRELARGKHSPKFPLGVAFTPDGRWLLAVSNDATAVVWDVAGWQPARAFAWKAGKLRAVAVSPDGTRAACGGPKGRVVVWDLDL